MVLTAGGGTGAPSDHRITLKILHVNDIHSFLEPGTLNLSLDGTETACEIGGMARVASLIHQRTEEGKNHLVLHAGDAVQGSLYFTLFEGRADAEVMNTIHFDAVTIGNHEFDEGNDWLADFIRQLNSPVISANIEVPDGDSLDNLFTPYIIRKFDGIPVGIIGLTAGEATRRSSRPDNRTRFTEEVQTVQRAVDELSARGIVNIILLSHYGYKNDLALAGKVTNLDVIVGGDSHTLLGNFQPYGLHSGGAYPTVTQNADGDAVCVVQAWAHGHALGELEVTFENGSLSSWKGTPHLILGGPFTRKNNTGEPYILEGDALSRVIAAVKADPKLDTPVEDAAVATVVSKYSKQIGAYKQTIIGTAGEDLPHIRIPGTASEGVTLPMGSHLAPLVARAFYEQVPSADICIQNAGGVRIGLRAGDISYSTAYEMLPFSNTLFEIEMTGARIHQVLEDALSYIVKTGATGAFPYAYALKYDVDATQPYGSRIRNLEVKDRSSGIYSPIVENTRYVVVTSDYLAEGRDGYDTFAEALKQGAKGTDTYLDYTQAFVNHLKELTAAGRSLTRLPAEDHCIKSFAPPPHLKS